MPLHAVPAPGSTSGPTSGATPRGAAVLHLRVPVASTQGTLALDLEPRLDVPRAPDLGSDRVRRGLDQWVARYAQAAVEIVGGDRPVSQLARWTSREVYLDLERRALLVARAGSHLPGAGRVQPVRPRVHSVHACLVGDRVAETSVHVRYGERSRALAARFEQRVTRDRAARWVCTALEFA